MRRAPSEKRPPPKLAGRSTKPQLRETELRASPVVLLLIDVINPMDFPGAESLIPPATEAAHKIAQLAARARRCGIPVIYVNDNFDCWRLGFRELIDKLKHANVPGHGIIRLLTPEPRTDYYILKPSHSGFFRTGLDVLLQRLQTRTLILTGFATDICVLFTANDAYMRGFHVIVPPDCVASEKVRDNEHALRHMRRLLKADIVTSDAVAFDVYQNDLDGADGGVDQTGDHLARLDPADIRRS